MFDNFDLYETCEEYYNEKHAFDYYQYYLTNEERLEEREGADETCHQ